jgi:pimeloyl-ACP methyl ester carboxylesterase
VGAAHANDLFYAIEAAQAAFPELSDRFVLMGHSQGGLATWAAAERQAQRPVPGYLGAIAGSPVTQLEPQIRLLPVLAFYLAAGLDAIFPDFALSDWLTDAGLRRFELFQHVQGCNSAALQLLAAPDLIRPDFMTSSSSSSSAFQSYTRLAAVGGKPVKGPLLVLQGGADPLVPAELSTAAVDATCARYPGSLLEYVLLDGTEHVASLAAGQRVWLDWIAARFAGDGRPLVGGCVRRNFSSFRQQDAYQADGNYYLQYATQAYQVT